jgi:hypothetical protein
LARDNPANLPVARPDASVRIDDGIFGEHGNVALWNERIHRPHIARHHVLDGDAVFVGAEIHLRGDEHGRDEERDESSRMRPHGYLPFRCVPTPG